MMLFIVSKYVDKNTLNLSTRELSEACLFPFPPHKQLLSFHVNITNNTLYSTITLDAFYCPSITMHLTLLAKLKMLS